MEGKGKLAISKPDDAITRDVLLAQLQQALTHCNVRQLWTLLQMIDLLYPDLPAED